MTNESRFILMLEDDPDDRFITQSTLDELGYQIKITFVKSSNELFQYLQRTVKPDLILLDYNASPHNAIDILKVLKKEPELKSIPVVILSDSSSIKLKQECYANGACSYIKKPTSELETRNKINGFFNYWLSVVEA